MPPGAPSCVSRCGGSTDVIPGGPDPGAWSCGAIPCCTGLCGSPWLAHSAAGLGTSQVEEKRGCVTLFPFVRRGFYFSAQGRCFPRVIGQVSFLPSGMLRLAGHPLAGPPAAFLSVVMAFELILQDIKEEEAIEDGKTKVKRDHLRLNQEL